MVCVVYHKRRAVEQEGIVFVARNDRAIWPHGAIGSFGENAPCGDAVGIFFSYEAITTTTTVTTTTVCARRPVSCCTLYTYPAVSTSPVYPPSKSARRYREESDLNPKSHPALVVSIALFFLPSDYVITY